jgi:hypothetical protein
MSDRAPGLDRRRHLSFRHAAAAMFHNSTTLAGLVASALALGMCIYHWAMGLPWIDAFLNASMILAGMGPVYQFVGASDFAKALAGGYALFSGLVVLVIAGAMLGPLVHTVLHRFHVESPETRRSHESN